MNILDVALAGRIAASGGGGGSGTDNYNDLSNLPQINGETLAGNKSSSNLGLQDEIDSDHKLSSDLVDDANHTNKFVTSTEKQTWSAKQNAIDADHKLSSDLVDDANKTNKFVTSTEKQTWNNKQNAIDLDHKLSSSLVSFTTAEAAALASGIDSAKVGQISTNQTNILYTLNRTGKNLLRELPTQTINGVTLTNNGDGTYTITRTATSTSQASFIFGNNDNGRFTGCKMTGGASGYGLKSRTSSGVPVDTSTDWTTAVTISATAVGNITVNVESNENPQNVQIRPFVCDAEMYAKDPSFTMPALPNYDLTRLESEDRAALAEEIDAGAKNLVNLDACTITSAYSNITIVERNGNEVTVSCDGTQTTAISIDITGLNVPTNQFLILSGCASGGGDDSFQLDAYNNGAFLADSVDIGNGSNPFKFTTMTNSKIRIRVSANASFTNKVFKIMLCTKAAFGVSSKFVPYRLNYDLVCQNIKDVNTVLEAVL